MARITINGITVDPEVQRPQLQALGFASETAESSNYILIQCTAPLNRDQRDQLARLGVSILEYAPENTYICLFKPADLSSIRALAFVRWVNVFLKDFKISPELRRQAPWAGPLRLLDLPTAQILANDQLTVDIVLHKDAMGDDVVRAIATAAGADVNTIRPAGEKVRLSVERRRLPALAEIDAVKRIEPFYRPVLFNNIARTIIQADVAQAQGSMKGQGQVVCVCDTGFDKGDPRDVHPAFTSRVIKLYPLGRATSDDPNGHGTHVCGSVLGSGTLNDGTPIAGTAPAAELIMQSVLDANNQLGGLPADLTDLFTPPYTNDGIRIHTNSWGGNSAGQYTSNCQEVDAFVWNHRDFVVCFASGNAGSDAAGAGRVALGSVGTPAAAKNCITVGASENRRANFSINNQVLTYGLGWPSDFPAPPIKADPVADNSEGMVAFSSRGPTQSGRIRPDVVAPGTSILSTKSRVTTGNGWAASNDPAYFYDGGTSMATPLVAGCAAVTRQYLMANGQAAPSAALVKAMLINGAAPLSGQYNPPEVGSPPDPNEGFGRVDLVSTVGPYPAGVTVTFKDEATALDTGQSEDSAFQLTAGGSAKVTLVWTDMSGDALQNDLDLILIAPDGQEHHGNMPSGSADFDRVNNVEQAGVSTAVAGQMRVRVNCFRSVQPQSYALVVRVRS